MMEALGTRMPWRKSPRRPQAFFGVLAFVIGVAVCFVESRPAASQAEISVVARVDRNVVYVGDEAALQVIVEGNFPSDLAAPELPQVRNVIVRGPRRFQEMSSRFNGRTTQRTTTLTFTYSLQPTERGIITIPPIAFEIDGYIYRTELLQLRATEAPVSDFFTLVQDASKVDPYVGEAVTVTLRFYISKSCQPPTFRIPWLASKSVAAVLTEGVGSRRKVELGVEVPGNQRVLAYPFSQGQEQFRGGLQQVYSVTHKIYARKPGRVRLGAVTSRVSYESGTELVQGLFGRLRKVPKTESSFVASNEIEFEVKPLPEEGRPRGFTGAVGDFSFKVEATPTVVDVGQPIDLTMTILGDGLMNDLTPPDLSDQSAVTERFKISGDRVGISAKSSNRKAFTQTVRAVGGSVTEIPSIEFPYFDPARGEYRMARSEPVPLTVRDSEITTGRDIERAPGESGSGPKSEVKSLARGISELHTGVDALEDQSARFYVSGFNLVLWTAPPGLYAFLFVLTMRRRRLRSDSALLRKKGARRGAMKRLEEAREAVRSGEPQYDAVAKGICAYIGDRTNTPAAGLTADEVADRLRSFQVEDGLVARVRDLIQECDLGRFAASASEGNDDLLVRAEAMIRELEKAKF